MSRFALAPVNGASSRLPVLATKTAPIQPLKRKAEDELEPKAAPKPAVTSSSSSTFSKTALTKTATVATSKAAVTKSFEE